MSNRQVNLSRGKFLGGSSGVNGTLVVRGVKQDFDDWNLEGWSGEEFFDYMKKVGAFNLTRDNTDRSLGLGSGIPGISYGVELQC